ncbi:LOW QUALITY PROTEIN: hypothetical protein HZS_28 [Henneguya salminicola]|nr:LOW QUALITY PROTEIN: hypothetical protein HZS_28 [Henneguya salminicola]
MKLFLFNEIVFFKRISEGQKSAIFLRIFSNGSWLFRVDRHIYPEMYESKRWRCVPFLRFFPSLVDPHVLSLVYV